MGMLEVLGGLGLVAGGIWNHIYFLKKGFRTHQAQVQASFGKMCVCVCASVSEAAGR